MRDRSHHPLVALVVGAVLLLALGLVLHTLRASDESARRAALSQRRGWRYDGRAQGFEWRLEGRFRGRAWTADATRPRRGVTTASDRPRRTRLALPVPGGVAHLAPRADDGGRALRALVAEASAAPGGTPRALPGALASRFEARADDAGWSRLVARGLAPFEALTRAHDAPVVLAWQGGALSVAVGEALHDPDAIERFVDASLRVADALLPDDVR